MSMNIGAYNQNSYVQYNPAYRPRDIQAKDDSDREEKQAIALSEELAASAVPDQQVNTKEPKQHVVEGASDSDGLQQDHTNNGRSYNQMGMMDIQAAFFGFSSRRATDIQPVEMGA